MTAAALIFCVRDIVMDIAEYTPADIGLEWIERIEKCGWKAAGILADLLREESRFDKILRGGALYILKDGEELVSFATLTGRECIDADDLYPWIGFVFTAPEYRDADMAVG